MRNIAIFASGSGTNAENLIEYFSTKNSAKVTLVLSNNRDSMALKRAEKHDVKTVFFERDDFYVSGKVLDCLLLHNIDFIVLENIIEIYNGRIINVHPALLPRYGGKGMYGEIVHKAVIENRETESGITIHYVNKHYDEGDIVFQAKCKVDPADTHSSLAVKIHALEYQHFPGVIEELVGKLPDFGY